MDDDSADRIARELRSWVEGAAPGARVPSNRALVAEYSASPLTVQKAMSQLIGAGLIESRPGVGTFVRASRPARIVDYGWQTGAMQTITPTAPTLSSAQRTVAPDAIELHSGYPARDLLPGTLVRAAINRAARTNAVMTAAPAAGVPELQAWFANELASSSPSGITPASERDALIVAGSQSGLTSILRTLVGTGRPLLIESPTYWGAILAAKHAGVPLVPLPTGPEGPDPEDVERAFSLTGARAFYAQPTFANPTGTQWSRETTHAVLEVVRRRGAFLIEDDWAHDLAIDAEPRPVAAHDDDGHVVYLRSLTKSVSPSLRVAAVIARGPARERILGDRAAESMYVSHLLQRAALDVVTQPAWNTYLREFRNQLRTRRNLLLTSLAEHAPTSQVESTPAGGLHLWVRLPERTNVGQLAIECESRGVTIATGRDWFPAEPTGNYIRLNYAAENPERFPEAATIIGSALETQLR